jgi:hypothetical protein
MLAFSVLAFGIVSFFVSFLIGRSDEQDRGAVATYVTLTSWASLVCGLLIARFMPN